MPGGPLPAVRGPPAGADEGTGSRRWRRGLRPPSPTTCAAPGTGRSSRATSTPAPATSRSGIWLRRATSAMPTTWRGWLRHHLAARADLPPMIRLDHVMVAGRPRSLGNRRHPVGRLRPRRSAGGPDRARVSTDPGPDAIVGIAGGGSGGTGPSDVGAVGCRPMAVTENVTPLHAPDALPPMDTSGRVDRLRDLLDGAGCDALVVTNLTNVRYLVGFSGSAGQLLVTADRAVFVTDGRYREQSADEIAGRRPRPTRSRSRSSARSRMPRWPRSCPDRPGCGSASKPMRSRGPRSGDGPTTWSRPPNSCPTSGVVEALRLVKDPGEAARIRSACAVADAAFAMVRPRLADGVTEAEFALDLDMTMRSLGASDVSFETIVAAGTERRPAAPPPVRPPDRRG